MLSLPPGTVATRQVVGGSYGVRYPHVLSIVANFGSRPQRHHAQQHYFRQPSRILERARRRRPSLGGIHPIEFVTFSRNARKFLRRLTTRSVQRVREASRV